MPCRQHSEYLRSLYLNNDLADGHYLVDGKPIALSDIWIPIFALGTQRDTVSPWHAVYKIHLLVPAEVTFCLSSGGHNVGVVNPPGPGVRRSYQIATRKAGARYIDPDTWRATMPEHEGSWWPALEHWLRRQSGERVAPPSMGNEAGGYPVLGDAPGRYAMCWCLEKAFQHIAAPRSDSHPGSSRPTGYLHGDSRPNCLILHKTSSTIPGLKAGA